MKNRGFTLVELIVVIVILAILIGVTIGGIYMYVGKARENTDENNRSEIEKLIGLTIIDAEPRYREYSDDIAKMMGDSDSLDIGCAFAWSKHIPNDQIEQMFGDPNANAVTKAFDSILLSEMAKVFPDGLPASKSGKYFFVSINYNFVGDLSNANVHGNSDTAEKNTSKSTDSYVTVELLPKSEIKDEDIIDSLSDE